MSLVIGLIIATLGAYFYEIDFCTLYTFISVALELYKSYEKRTHDKTALQQ